MDSYDKLALSAGAEKHDSKVKDVIQYCSYDQPYDEGEVFWLWRERIDLIDVLAEHKIPEKYSYFSLWSTLLEDCFAKSSKAD